MYLLITEYDDDMPPMINEVESRKSGYKRMEDIAQQNRGIWRATLYERNEAGIYNVVTWRDNRH